MTTFATAPSNLTVAQLNERIQRTAGGSILTILAAQYAGQWKRLPEIEESAIYAVSYVPRGKKRAKVGFVTAWEMSTPTPPYVMRSHAALMCDGLAERWSQEFPESLAALNA